MRLGDSGRVIFALTLGDSVEKRYHSPYLNIHRADLHRILVDAVREKSATAIHLGYEVKALQQTPERVTVHFMNGESAQGDLLVGAVGGAVILVTATILLRVTAIRRWRREAPVSVPDAASPTDPALAPAPSPR